jgi:hypothetical protein
MNVLDEIRALDALTRADDQTPERTLTRAATTDRETVALAESVLSELLPDVSALWLAPVAPVFNRLVELAQDGRVTDEAFVEAIHDAALALPELFDRMGTEDLAEALEAAMGAATVNGAIARQRLFEAQG